MAAIGSTNDMVARMKAVLPAGWFPAAPAGQPSATPVLDGVLTGLGWMLSQSFALLTYANLQTRIGSATDIWLDLSAQDYFNTSLTRKNNEADTAFSERIQASLLPPAGTRAAISAAVEALTGTPPVIFEPFNPGDCGAYGYGGLAYGAAVPGLQDYRQSTATYIGSDGTMQIAAANTLRVDYSGGSPVTLIEGASSNTALNSTTAAVGSPNVWVNNGDFTLAISVDVSALLSGANVYKSVVTTANPYAFVAGCTETANQQYTQSAWVWLPVGWNSAYTVGIKNDGLGALTNVVDANPNLTGAWQRVSATGTDSAGSSNVILGFLLAGTNTTTNAPIGTTFYVTCPQCEPGAIATSFIPTNGGGTVSRAADTTWTAGGGDGGYGNLNLPAQAFITAYRQIDGGIPNIAGYSGNESTPNYAPGGYGYGLIQYATLDLAGTQIEDEEIYEAIANTQASGVTCWTAISNPL